MLADSILAAIAGRLMRERVSRDLRHRAFVVAGKSAGQIDVSRAARLARFSCFHVGQDALTLDPSLATPGARTAALAKVANTLRDEGALPAWRDETYAIATEFGTPPLCLIERGAARYFGLRTWAAHVNGIVRGSAGDRLWFARRSPRKAVDPGLLDNLVGGGIAAGLRAGQTVVKEAWEEAGIGEALARSARPAGIVHVRRSTADGLQRETIFVHDLVLPPDFMPANQDGEAVEHRLVDEDAAARIIASQGGSDQATLDASRVVADYFVRCGTVGPDQPDYAALTALLREPP